MNTISREEVMTQLGGAYFGLLPAMLLIPALTDGAFGLHSSAGWLVLWAAIMAGHDLVRCKIPNRLNLLVAGFGLAYATLNSGLPGLGQAALGGLTGFAIMAVFFFLGAIGAGDVKAIGALATLLSPQGALFLIIWTLLCGGPLAIARIIGGGSGLKPLERIKLLRSSRAEMNMPYGLAILGGCIALVTITPGF